MLTTEVSILKMPIERMNSACCPNPKTKKGHDGETSGFESKSKGQNFDLLRLVG